MPVPRGASHEAALAACTVPVRPSLVVSGWTIRPVAWAAAAADSAGVVLEGWRGGAPRWRTRRVSLVSLAAGVAADDGQPLLLALERHPSAMDGEVATRPHVYAVGDRGLVAKWRGTALAWPLLDAVVDADGSVCALHRGDSFLRLDRTVTATRTMRYRWNGFGFSAASDPGSVCARTFRMQPA
jgi:poly-gamma-glutamate synthesis protein (capsule biosynthesis protein)